MKKLTLVIDANNPDKKIVDFGCDIARIMHAELTGLFVENLTLAFLHRENAAEPGYPEKLQEKHQVAFKTDTDQAIGIFIDLCNKKNVHCQARAASGDLVNQVLFESRFSDLMVMDPNIGFYEEVDHLPTPVLKEILRNSECPVLLAPNYYEGIDEIIFCYDGTAQSVFAMKHFIYLFPGLANRCFALLQLGKEPDKHVEGDEKIVAYLKAHFPKVKYRWERGTNDDDLFAHLFMQKKKLIVMGAYGRSIIGNIFRRSSADVLIRAIDLPIFIAHY